MFKIFIMSLLTLASTTISAQTIQECLHGQTSKTIPLQPQQGNYITGNIQFSQMDYTRAGISAQLFSGSLKRTLFSNKTNEQNLVLWLPEQHNTYALHIDAPEQPNLCYTLTLNHQHAQLQPQNHEPNTTPQSLRLRQILQSHNRPQAVNQFWQDIQQQGAPLIEPLNHQQSLVTFIYRGAKHNVRLIGAPSNDHEWLVPLPQTDIWYKSFVVDNHIRLSYRFAPDVPTPILAPETPDAAYQKRRALLAVLQADTLNPHRYGEQSLLDLNKRPNHPTPPKGSLKQYAFHSVILGNQRRIWLYQNRSTNRANPIFVYLFDGQNYLDETQLLANLDKLPDSMPPIYLVLIDNTNRAQELPVNSSLNNMLAKELFAFIAQQTGIPHQPQRSVLAGSSYGGLATAYFAHQYPDLIHYFVPMSGSFWWKKQPTDPDNGLKTLFIQQPTPPLHWYISAGSYETTRHAQAIGILETSQELAELLKQQGHTVQFQKIAGSHDYAIWENVLPHALKTFFNTTKH
ncbi:alpha/beta hydrolase-fold protein [Neisseria sp. S1]|uniref:alpha/beta hydrolase-fold protein n=1 Tax=Neisseria sp. S1 TaxID=3318354 RepID=UPI003A8900D5